MAIEKKKNLAVSRIFGDDRLLEQNQIEDVDIKNLGLKHRWLPPHHSLATFIFLTIWLFKLMLKIISRQQAARRKRKKKKENSAI